MGTIIVVYYSHTGNTRKMAELVAEGAGQDGKHKVKLVEVGELDIGEFTGADGFAFGSPDYFTYMSGKMKTLFDKALAKVGKLKGKPFVSFVSHGGGGGAIESLNRLGAAIGLKQVHDGVKSLGAPKKQAAEACRNLGEHLASAVGH
jgi:NAD(P)H dehydrogenase (quinone)